jgi:hypothetical protein
MVCVIQDNMIISNVVSDPSKLRQQRGQNDGIDEQQKRARAVRDRMEQGALSR